MNPKKKYHVLEDELDRLNYGTPTTLKGKWLMLTYDILSRSILLTLHLPAYVILRAEILCDDISEQAKKPFRLENLIELLYEEFLRDLKETNNTYLSYRRLLSHAEYSIQVKTSQGYFTTKKEKKTVFKLSVPRKKVLRGEVFIHDVSQHVDELDLTIELILETLITDFMQKYSSGEIPTILDELIDNLTSS